MSSSVKLWSRVVRGCLVLGVAGIAMGSVGCAGTQKKDEELEKVQTADWFYQSGAGYFESHEVPLAIQQLHHALEKDPNHVQAHYLLGYIYMGRRQYTKAVTHFKAASDNDPKFYDATNALGATYLAMERWRDASELFEKLLEEPLYGSPELAHNNAGWAYYNMRQYTVAIEHFRMATFLKPEFCLGYNNMGLTQQAMNARSEALRSFKKAIDLCPTNYAEPHFNLAKLYQDQGDGVAARDHFQRCTELANGSQLGDRCQEYLNY